MDSMNVSNTDSMTSTLDSYNLRRDNLLTINLGAGICVPVDSSVGSSTTATNSNQNNMNGENEKMTTKSSIVNRK